MGQFQAAAALKDDMTKGNLCLLPSLMILKQLLASHWFQIFAKSNSDEIELAQKTCIAFDWIIADSIGAKKDF